MQKISFVFLLSLGICAHTFGSVTETWEESSDPSAMSGAYETKWDRLPLSASLPPSDKLWSGDYWSLKSGSINYRWNATIKTGFQLVSPSKELALSMSLQQINELSPAEKYDLYLGRYDYPLKNEVAEVADPKAEVWEGMCHGWSAATLNHTEPTPKIMRNPDGIEVAFGSSDIKALISYYYGYIYQSPTNFQVGRRCYKTPRKADKDCQNDPNAGAFHLVLVNRIALEKRSFVLDLQRFEEVWNHPVAGYSSSVLAEYRPDERSAPGTVRVLKVRTVVTIVDETENSWKPVLGTKNQAFDKRTYDYKIELDKNGNVIGGDWLSVDRPDFMWSMTKPTVFKGTLSKVWQLLND